MAYPAADGYIRIAILTILLIYLLSFKPPFSIGYFGRPLFLYFISIIISVFYSINIRSSLLQFYQISTLLCLLFLVSNLGKKQSKRLISAILFSAFLLSLYAIYQYIWGFSLTKGYIEQHLKHLLETRYVREILFTRRAIAAFFSPNMFGAYLAMTIPLCAGIILGNINRNKPCVRHWLYLVLMLIALVLTKSAAAWISLALGSFVFILLNNRLSRKRTLIICIVILLMPVFILFLRFDMFFDLVNQQNTILQRLSFWRSSLRIIGDFPLKGIGIGNLGNIYPKYMELLANETMFSHNIFLQTWAETGILGLVSIILLLFTFIKAGSKIQKSFFNIGLLASSYVFIINNMFDFSYFIPQVSFLWWINMGLIAQKNKSAHSKLEHIVKPIAVIIISALILLNIISLTALAYFRKGEYKKAIAMEPYNDLYYIAMEDYSNAIRLNPYSPFYHKNLASRYLSKNMVKEAVSELEKASQLYPANPHLHQQLFDLYEKTGESEKAEKEKAILKEFHAKYSGYFIR